MLGMMMQREEPNTEAKAAPQPAKEPAPSEAAALNAKAEAAAAQPLPDSDDSDDDALGVVKGITRTGGPKENGAPASKATKVAPCPVHPMLCPC